VRQSHENASREPGADHTRIGVSQQDTAAPRLFIRLATPGLPGPT
jgi:hypothetical protein